MNDADKSKMELAKQTKQLVDNFDAIAVRELYDYIAVNNKIRYDSYIKAGFSAEQALQLCTTK